MELEVRGSVWSDYSKTNQRRGFHIEVAPFAWSALVVYVRAYWEFYNSASKNTVRSRLTVYYAGPFGFVLLRGTKADIHDETISFERNGGG